MGERDEKDLRWIDPEILISEEEQLAAEEAAAIGGRAGDENLDPAERPVREAGGGESEGFEMSEQDLIRHASHGDDVSDSIVFHDAGKPEAEADRQTAASGDADHIDTANRIEEEN
jgi:hypothetical protein